MCCMNGSVKTLFCLLLIISSFTQAAAQPNDIDNQINRYKLNHNLALMEQDFKKAIDNWRAVTELSRQKYGEWHPNYAIELTNLGRLYAKIAELEQARNCYFKAFEIMDRAGLQNNKNYASMLNDMVNWCIALGDDASAKLYHEKSETILAQIGESDNDPTWLFNNGQFLLKNKNYKSALNYFNLALRSVKERTTDHAVILDAIGTTYGELGEMDNAINCYNQATEILSENIDRDHRVPALYAKTLYNISVEYYKNGMHDNAKNYLLRTLNQQKNIYGTDHPDYTKTLNALIQITRPMGEINPQLTQELFNNCRNDIRKNFQFLPEYQRESNIHNIYDTYFNTLYTVTTHRTVRHLPDMAKLMYNTALLSKGLLLSTSIEFRQMIEESNNPKLLDKYHELVELNTQLNAEKQKLVTDRKDEIKQIEQRAQKLEAELIQEVKAVGDYTRNLDLTWEDVAQSEYIGPNDVAVEFIDYNDGDREYAVAVLRKGWDTPKVYYLCTERELKELIGTSSTMSSLQPSIHNGVYENNLLYEKIWAPIKENIKAGDRILFSPSGLLHTIGLEYLPVNKKANTRMCDVYRMFRCSSTRQIAMANYSSGTNVAHLYGDISYHLNETDMQFYYNNMNNIDRVRGNNSTEEVKGELRSISRPSNTFWTQLEGTRKEIAEIEPLLETAKNIQLSVETHTKADASEQSFKSISGKRSKIIHIATHGYYNKQDNSKEKEHSTVLSRSALIFAGAGNDELYVGMDDGYLTAEEISLLDLRDTELVVLSACQSGQGESTSAEGLDGLQRAFKKAGVQTLVVSLWDVSDVVTQEIMVAFYKYYSEGYNWRDSFEKALSDIRRKKDYKSPKYWAPFVMID